MSTSTDPQSVASTESTMKKLRNGNTLYMDCKGRIDQLVTANGDTFQYSYGIHGRINRIQLPDGTCWVRRGKRHWTIESASGEFVGPLDGYPSWDPEGNLWLTSKEGILRLLSNSCSGVQEEQDEVIA